MNASHDGGSDTYERPALAEGALRSLVVGLIPPLVLALGTLHSEASQSAGHSGPNTTAIYTHVTPRKERERLAEYLK
jgi:hypothetical protein